MSERPSVILVVGMHRSGTSAVTRVLNLLGAELPGTLVPGGLGNERGHWETAEVVELHDQMLWSAGVNVNGVFAIRPEWFRSPEATRYAHALAALMNAQRPWPPLTVIKDPRMALFIPIWLKALDGLGLQPRFVLPFRHPMEVALSLRRRQLQHFPDSVWPPGRALLLWLRYVLTAERETRKRPRSFVGFDALLEDWPRETARMGRQLRLDWPKGRREAEQIEAFLHRDERHQTVDLSAPLPPLAADVFRQLNACVRSPYAGGRAFRRTAEAVDAAGALFAEYVCGLEAKIASVPTLKTEYPDFPPLERLFPPVPEATGRKQVA